MLIMIYEGCPKIYDLPEEAATVGGELNQLKQRNIIRYYSIQYVQVSVKVQKVT